MADALAHAHEHRVVRRLRKARGLLPAVRLEGRKEELLALSKSWMPRLVAVALVGPLLTQTAPVERRQSRRLSCLVEP